MLLSEEIHRQILGLMYSVFSGLSVTVTAVCQKHLQYLPPPQFCIYRYLGVFIYSLFAMMYYKQSPVKSKKVTILISTRGCLLGFSYIAFFYALNYIPLSDYSALAASSPVFAIIMARIFLKEHCGVIHVICLFLTVLGVVLVSKLPLVISTRTTHYDTSYFVGIGITMLFNLIIGFATIVVRVPEVKKIHNSVILFYLGILSVCECFTISAVIYGFVPPHCGVERFIPLILSFAGVGIDIFAVLGLQYQPAAVFIVVYSSSNIIGSYVWNIVVDGVIPNAYTISGTTVMVACILLLAASQCTLMEQIFKQKKGE